MIKVYVVVREDNQGFIGVYGTLEDAKFVAREVRVPTEIIERAVPSNNL
jgi:hypothetical protein